MTNPPADRLRRPSGIRSLTLGDTRLSYVPDGRARLEAMYWLDTTDEDWAPYAGHLDDGHLVGGVGGLLVERGGRGLLIDAGAGPLTLDTGHGVLTGGALLENLAVLGRGPEEIEAVAVTHLHVDHIGWAAHPAFARARVLVAAPEWTHRQEPLEALEPRVRTVVDGEEVFPGVRVLSAPGHTAGHTAYVVDAGGQRVIAFGDAFHFPVQISRPEWEVTADHDRKQAVALRHRLLAELAGPGTIGFGVHFSDVVFGRVTADGGTYLWHPVDA
ncbi:MULTISPECIES: MBL fold metallo-hydrolase [unclassified Streptomyces]|uniref:MBL fold metallo-hydrolase n=1 Tax=unclassified Streptomyces TaxID=2593676 RepID=UPI000DD67494|nr:MULTISPECIES: MBL fold metallo-hydrolase [unclassified Streptomyces]QZZ32341.1 MBL fold metallo-hydrolase [Streptomyces sp. ST1015]